MKQALSLARLALGQVSPNPAVGAVIVKDDIVIGQGYTQPPGSAHAEMVALHQAGEKARGGVMYVTLEPCCHYGRTPPCAKSIIAAGISEVHMALLDPNPLVSGRGADELEKAGIKTFVGEHDDEARQIMEAYIKYITTGMPFVTAKFAVSLDGKIATRSGDSQWISGVESRRYAHYLRYINDAIMVGANTVIADNPHLTSRCAGKGGAVKKRPVRIIVDGRGRVSPEAQLFTEPGKTVIALGKSVEAEKKHAFSQAGAEVIDLPVKDDLLDMKRLLKKLGEREITSVVVEGGGILLGSLFDSHLVDKVVAFISPVIIGGQAAKAAVAGSGIEKMFDASRLERVNVEKFGEDVMVTGYVRQPVPSKVEAR